MTNVKNREGKTPLAFSFLVAISAFFAKFEFDRITNTLQDIAVKQEVMERTIAEMRVEIRQSQQTIEKVTETKPKH